MVEYNALISFETISPFFNSFNEAVYLLYVQVNIEIPNQDLQSLKNWINKWQWKVQIS